MSRGMGFGIGAGAVSLLATVLALSPTVRGDADSQVAEGGPKKVERKRESKVDRQVRILMRGGSYLGVRLEDVDQEDMARAQAARGEGRARRERRGRQSRRRRPVCRPDDVIVRYHGEARARRDPARAPGGGDARGTHRADRGGARRSRAEAVGHAGGRRPQRLQFRGRAAPIGSLHVPSLAGARAPLVPPVPPVPPVAPHPFDRPGANARSSTSCLVRPRAAQARHRVPGDRGPAREVFQGARGVGRARHERGADGPAAKAGSRRATSFSSSTAERSRTRTTCSAPSPRPSRARR